MGLHKTLTRNRSGSTGSLGSVERSIGYLQGGYKDATIHSKVQLFNTITQVGAIVYDTGYQRYYRPGVSGNYSGYFSVSDTILYNKFNYITSSASTSFSTGMHPGVTVSDLNIYSQAWLLCTTAPSLQNQIDSWVQLNLSTDTPTNHGNLSPSPSSTTRQAMGTGIAGFFINMNTTNMHILNFTTKVVSTTAGVAGFDNGIQIPCGMSVSDTKGYMVGMLGRNNRINVNGTTVLSYAVATAYAYNFGESHSVATSGHGFMMAGYSDTTGRYGNTQHGLCQKITFATESISTLPDLALAQSSGQMMQGF